MWAHNVSPASLLPRMCQPPKIPASPACPRSQPASTWTGCALNSCASSCPEGTAAEGSMDSLGGAAPTGRCGESPWSLLGSHHPKPGIQPQAGRRPASRVSFAYHCLFWRLLGSESPPEGNLWLWGLVTPETLNSQGSPAHSWPPQAGAGANYFSAWPSSGLPSCLSTAAISERRRTLPRQRSWTGPALIGCHLGISPMWSPAPAQKRNYKHFVFLP